MLCPCTIFFRPLGKSTTFHDTFACFSCYALLWWPLCRLYSCLTSCINGHLAPTTVMHISLDYRLPRSCCASAIVISCFCFFLMIHLWNNYVIRQFARVVSWRLICCNNGIFESHVVHCYLISLPLITVWKMEGLDLVSLLYYYREPLLCIRRLSAEPLFELHWSSLDSQFVTTQNTNAILILRRSSVPWRRADRQETVKSWSCEESREGVGGYSTEWRVVG